MSFRDDGDALLARMAALEHEVDQAAELRLRIAQLELANELLRETISSLRAQITRQNPDRQVSYVAELLADAERRQREKTRTAAPPPRAPLSKTAIARAVTGVLTAVQRLERDGHLATTLPIDEDHLIAKAHERAADRGAAKEDIGREDLADAIRDVLTSRLILRAGADATIDEVADAIIAQVL